jgi:hypothetical protein
MIQAVLRIRIRIRIREDPSFLAGTESESEIFVPDPVPDPVI